MKIGYGVAIVFHSMLCLVVRDVTNLSVILSTDAVLSVAWKKGPTIHAYEERMVMSLLKRELGSKATTRDALCCWW